LNYLKSFANARKDSYMAEDKKADMPSCCARYKQTPRGHALDADLQKRLNRVIGQLQGVKTMIDDNRYCGDVLMQLAASEKALQSISRIVLKNHVETCVVEKIQDGDVQVVDELFDLIKRFSN
jgi:DNA-binding FrmR family transcriptional regulator